MGYRILQKNSGKYAVWNDTTGCIIMDDVDEQVVRAWWLGNAITNELDRVNSRIQRAQSGHENSRGLPDTYDEAVEMESQLHQD